MQEVYFSIQEFGHTNLIIYLTVLQFLLLIAHIMTVLQLLLLIAHIMIVLQLLPPNPHNLNFLSYVQKKFHFPELQQTWSLIQ